MNITSCGNTDSVHRLDEIGAATETVCQDCGKLLAPPIETPEGMRWRLSNGRVLPQGRAVNARRPDLKHTCRSSSSLPCPACAARGRDGRRRSGSRSRRIFARATRT